MQGGLHGMLCEFPYWRFEIHQGGDVLLCCPTWLPTVVGNITENSFLEIYDSEPSRKIRASMEKGEFEFCNKELCPYLNQYLKLGRAFGPLVKSTRENLTKSLEKKQISLVFCYDKSCNLRCPSCRNNLEIYSENDLPPDILKVHNAIVKNINELEKNGFTIFLNITGSGDPFASPLFYKLLKELPYSPRLFLEIQTNGVLMEEKRFTPAMTRMMQFLAISIDAFNPSTYEIVRRGGNFEKLKTNLDWINKAALTGRFEKLECYKVNFIVQKDNYKEIVDFAKWMLTYDSVNEIWFNLIADWGHLSKPEFESKAVWMPSHPEHGEFLAVLKDPFLRSNPKINLGNLSGYIT